jgi:NADH-quinone oxidoreductase subunit C
MDFQGIHDRLRAVRAPGLLGVDEPRAAVPGAKHGETKDPGRGGDSFVMIDPQKIVEFLHVCRDEDRLRFELLVDLTATDPKAEDPNLWINLNLLSVERRQRLAVKALLPKSALSMPSSAAIYRAAQWHERECAEMYGITFVGHPDPRHILLPDDWIGYPLRKDYVFPKEYHGISCE